MLANAELTQDFTILNQQYRELVQALLEIVNIPFVPITVDAENVGNFRGFDSGELYVVIEGSLSARYQNRTIYTLQPGDLLLPDITGDGADNATVYFGSETGASLQSFSALEFMQRVFENSQATKIWTQLLVTYAGLILRISAARTREDVGAAPAIEIFEPGQVIIMQGERADFVFNLSSGVADVSVDGVQVGSVDEGEIFGAMAALTHADRSATVTARTRCSVVKVPEAQFAKLIKSNPSTIHGLLVDMANSIVNLNQQLVALNDNTRA